MDTTDLFEDIFFNYISSNLNHYGGLLRVFFYVLVF